LNIFQIKITRKDFVGYFSVETKAKRTKINNLSTRFVRVAEVDYLFSYRVASLCVKNWRNDRTDVLRT